MLAPLLNVRTRRPRDLPGTFGRVLRIRVRLAAGRSNIKLSNWPVRVLRTSLIGLIMTVRAFRVFSVTRRRIGRIVRHTVLSRSRLNVMGLMFVRSTLRSPLISVDGSSNNHGTSSAHTLNAVQSIKAVPI